jgi:hypothetical protein
MSKENNPVEMDEEGQNFLETVTQQLVDRNTLATANFCFLVIGQCSPDGNAVNTAMAIDPSRVAPEHFAHCIVSILKAADNLGQKMRPMMLVSALTDIFQERAAQNASDKKLAEFLAKLKEEGLKPPADTGENNVSGNP